MAKLHEATDSDISTFVQEAGLRFGGHATLEEAAQQLTQAVYTQYQDSIVQARVFATVPYAKLPVPNQAFVNNMAAAKGITHLIKDQTLVLSLLGTSGREEAWNNRRNSSGHVGIPMASADFIGLIPMMSRLLKALGVPLDWISSTDTAIVAQAIGKLAGVFYVPDAKTTVDEQGRKIIAAQDFVAKYAVKTVFGIGGGYVARATFVVMIVFTCEALTKRQAERFMPLINSFKVATSALVSQGRIFSL